MSHHQNIEKSRKALAQQHDNTITREPDCTIRVLFGNYFMRGYVGELLHEGVIVWELLHEGAK